jgi:hypothetical protein
MGAHTEHWSMALLRRVACNAFLQVLASSRQYAKPEPRLPEYKVSNNNEHRVVAPLPISHTTTRPVWIPRRTARRTL